MTAAHPTTADHLISASYARDLIENAHGEAAWDLFVHRHGAAFQFARSVVDQYLAQDLTPLLGAEVAK